MKANLHLPVIVRMTQTSVRLKLFLVFLGALIGSWVGYAWSGLEPVESIESIQEEIQQLRAQPLSEDADRLTHLAGLYLDLGDEIDQDLEPRIAAYEEGARLAQRALQINERNADAHFYYAANVGSSAYLQGFLASFLNLQDLTEHVTRTIELKEDHAPALHMRGMMLEELPWFLGGDSEEALKHLQLAVKADKYYMHARLNLGKVYLERDRIDEAVGEFLFIVHNRPPHSAAKWEKQYRPEAQRFLEDLDGEIASAVP